ncbi:MAG: aminotransferase class III-fold pyridoxal phosphate-dependent enzyme, partial [Anaerolineae bacterium]
GMGLMQALEIVDPSSPGGKAPDAPKAAQIMEESRKRGLLIGKGGLYDNVIRLTPPLIVSPREIDEALEVLDKVFAVP